MEGYMQQDADLQKMRREIQEKLNTQETDVGAEESKELDIRPAHRRVRHSKYGIGTVVKEDDNFVTVSFEGYGEKEFMKAFVGLEDIVE